MGTVHDLILHLGTEAVRRQASKPIDRLCIEAAAAVMGDESEPLGITHAGFALTSLPHKSMDGPVWKRQAGKLTLLVESGRTKDSDLVGLPYGAKARMILLYLQTKAIQSNSPEVELGPSMRAWLTNMGIETIGGATYRLIAEQARRIAACRLTFIWQADGMEARHNGSFVRSGMISLGGLRDGPRQPSLWQETVRLDDEFFRSLKDHPVPLLETALKQIGTRSVAIDVYIWLAYRLHALTKQTPVSWAAVHSQFGGGCRQLRDFKPTFLEALQLALAVYPEAKVEVDSKNGLVLHPSPPPVSRRVMTLSER